jgi:hypothetical protein
LTATLSGSPAIMDTFSFYGNYSDDYISKVTYRIYGNGSFSNVWANGTISSSPYNVTLPGIYLPVGNWIVNVTANDTMGNSNTVLLNLSSLAGIMPTLTSSSSQTATINTSQAVPYTFVMSTKGYPYVKLFLNLTAGTSQFLNAFVKIGNSTVLKDTSAKSDYSGSQSFTISSTTSSNVPAYVQNYSGIYNGSVTLYLYMYSGLSAGTYTGNYGWGLSDS